MNTNRSVEELLELFDVQNISQLRSDVIRELFNNLSYKEVMKLCRMSKRFNIACNNESMWKRKVRNDYGITKMYRSTWRKTAHLLFESNMINLNTNWVNGKTYNELFEEGLESKNDFYFRDLFHDLYPNLVLLPIVFPDYVHNNETAKEYLFNPELSMSWSGVSVSLEYDKELTYDEFNEDYDNILESENRINLQATIMTREFSVVAHAVAEIRGTHLRNDFGLAQTASDMSQKNIVDQDTNEFYPIIESYPKQKRMNRRLASLINPMLYVITYCLMNIRNLTRIDIWK